ncbi:hypothetical protein BMW23_0088 [Bodo saltans virus]|uniref:C2H2-type domain-containing protein n=1 Tax=Bodo saltans virus TaxID=2024608 RepID=A0A2H4UTH4_9VIRU|nr:hypothetical protein QJ851_gp0086 [Bodo saltans virus]ATZ80149.1 hypothetical protein BMW23_0088 [Bodo saltans virus]
MDQQEQKKFKYICEKCNYFTNAKSGWTKHVNSGLHIEGHRATRCDKKIMDNCPHCEYKTKNNTAMNTHVLNNHADKNERKIKYTYYCEYCDYGAFSEKHYKKHLITTKHKQMLELIKNIKAENSAF